MLVLLGAVVSRSSREGAVIPNAASAENSQPTDPLSDLGVAPGASADPGNNSAASHKAR